MTKRTKETRSISRKASRSLSRQRLRSKNAHSTSFEQLEDRRLLASITVGTAVDLVDGNTTSISALIASPGNDGAISLREALTASDNTAGTDTISFDANTFNGEAADVIRLQNELVVFQSVDIDAGDLGVVVSGDSAGDDTLVTGSFITDVAASSLAGTFSDNVNRVFAFVGAPGQAITISGLTITGGDSSFGGGGILSEDADLTINLSTVAGNRAATSGGGLRWWNCSRRRRLSH